MLQICINVGIFSFPRLGTSVNLSHDVPPLSKQLITVDDPIFFSFLFFFFFVLCVVVNNPLPSRPSFFFFFCSLGGCTYPSLLPAKDPLIRSDPYPKQNRVSLSPSSSERKGFPPPPKNKKKKTKKKTSKHCYSIQRESTRVSRLRRSNETIPNAEREKKCCWKKRRKVSSPQL